jgi:hypothetical protein
MPLHTFLHSLLNALVQIASKMGVQQNIYSSVQVSDVLVFTVRCKLINFVSQIFPLFIPEISAGFISLGSCNHCNLACFL